MKIDSSSSDKYIAIDMLCDIVRLKMYLDTVLGPFFALIGNFLANFLQAVTNKAERDSISAIGARQDSRLLYNCCLIVPD